MNEPRNEGCRVTVALPKAGSHWNKIDQHIDEAMYQLRTAQVRCHPKTRTRTKLKQALKHVAKAIALELKAGE